RRVARGAGAYNYEGRTHIAVGDVCVRGSPGVRPSLRYEQRFSAYLDVPARHGIQRRCMQGLSRTQAETGVVPGATHRVFVHDTFAERAAVMRARSANRKNLITPPNHDH